MDLLLQIKCLIWSVYDVLPAPQTSLARGMVETPICSLSHKRGSLEYIITFHLMVNNTGAMTRSPKPQWMQSAQGLPTSLSSEEAHCFC